MRRREAMTFIAAMVVLSANAAAAEEWSKVYRIAILHPSHPLSEMSATSTLSYYRAFFNELHRLGYDEGQNLMIDRYSAEGRVENYAELARYVASRNPSLVFTISNPMAWALKNATSTIPIVAITSDPIDAGLVQSLARPGGNLTGVSIDAGLEIWGKRFQLFREVIPAISKVGMLTMRGDQERTALLQTAEKERVAIVGPSLIDSATDENYRGFFAMVMLHLVELLQRQEYHIAC